MLTSYATLDWQKKIWPPGLPKDLKFSIGVKPLFEYLAWRAREHPERPAFIFYNREISYRQWDDMSNALAQFLLASGIKKGDRVAMLLPTFPGFGVAYMGISKMGGVVTACSPAFRE